jgi:hypothetical protein
MVSVGEGHTHPKTTKPRLGAGLGGNRAKVTVSYFSRTIFLVAVLSAVVSL